MDKSKNYLFICAFGQSRSKYFAERCMNAGFKSMFCGYTEDADFVLASNHFKWADVVVILDKDFKREKELWSDMIDHRKPFVKFFLDDEPSLFDKNFAKMIKCINKVAP